MCGDDQTPPAAVPLAIIVNDVAIAHPAQLVIFLCVLICLLVSGTAVISRRIS